MMYFFISAVRNVCGLVGCEKRTTSEHAAAGVWAVKLSRKKERARGRRKEGETA